MSEREVDKQRSPEQGIQPPYYPQPYYAAEDEIDLFELWQIIAGGKWLILSIVLLATTIAIGAALTMTPVYRAPVLTSPVSIDKGGGQLAALAGQFGGLASLAGISMPTSGGEVEMTIATLTSRKFLVEFAADNDLKKLLFDEAWDRDGKRWIIEDPGLNDKIKALIMPREPVRSVASGELLAEGEPSNWEVYKKLSEALAVSSDKITGLITVAVEWKDPVLAARWSNQLVDRINRVLREQAIDEAEKSIAYLKGQIAQTRLADLQAVLYRLIEEQTKSITLANVSDEYVLKVIDPAVVPEERIKPKRSLMVILGLVLGVMLGVFMVFVRSFIRKAKAGHALDNVEAGSSEESAA